MKEVLDELDPWQTATYLNTSREFEKIFNVEHRFQEMEDF